ncbi:hypothetical protein CLOM_g19172 [Closterium sp. NIES-68]|nr:hypothetical protein CLOM_g19172 [Closterium sp. NIES-68]
MTAGERGKDMRVAPQAVSELSLPQASRTRTSLELAGSGGACQPHPAPRTRVLFRGPACGGVGEPGNPCCAYHTSGWTPMPCESGDSDRGGGRRGRRCARLAERAALSSRVIPARQPVRERGMGRRPRRRELPWDRGPRGCRQGSRAPGYLWEGLPG